MKNDKNTWRTVGMQAVVFSLLAIGGLFAYVRFLEATTVFVPSRGIITTPKDVKLNYQDINFPSGKFQLNGWLVKAAYSPEKKTTLLFLHGNAGNIGDRLEKIQIFNQMGLNVFIFDYRGYGNSEGNPTEKGMYEDALAAYDYLMTRRDLNLKTIVVYGESLGGVAAVDLAVQRSVAALMVDSAFSSGADMAKHILSFVPTFFLSIKMDSAEKIKNVHVPKLFLHSPDDEIVPYELGKKLYAAAPPPKDFLKMNGGHNDGYFRSQEFFIQGIKNFLKRNKLI